MYQQLKSIAKSLLPQKMLFENEQTLRKLLLPLYKGNLCECNICNSKLKKFIPLENGNLLCPICGSLQRTRRLFKLLNDEFLNPGFSMLDFSPSRAIYRKLKNRPDITYYATDFENEFLADYHFDITNIDIENDSFDLISCYHILEHIVDDESAMSELYRVLKKSGYALIQTPFKEGNIYEDYSIKTPKEREINFGQDDHVRIYSVDGLEKRLQNAGFRTEIRLLTQDDYYGFTANECVIICTK